MSMDEMLVEFVLARITEDEDEDDACPCCDDGPDTISGRVRLEAESKRRIVEWAAPVLRNWPGAPEGFRYVSDDGRDLLRILAAVYADHPDYRPGWSL